MKKRKWICQNVNIEEASKRYFELIKIGKVDTKLINVNVL